MIKQAITRFTVGMLTIMIALVAFLLLLVIVSMPLTWAQNNQHVAGKLLAVGALLYASYVVGGWMLGLDVEGENDDL